MKLIEIKFYEGNNLKREKNIVKLSLKDATSQKISKVCDGYIEISQKLGFNDKLIEITNVKDEFIVWLMYSQEDATKFILTNLINNSLSHDDILKQVNLLLDDEFLYELSKKAKSLDIPVIKLCKDLYQFGYGKSSEVLGITYQSYEDMAAVQCSLNRAYLNDVFGYNNITTSYSMIVYNFSNIQNDMISYPVTICNVDKTFSNKKTPQNATECENDLKSFLSVKGEAFMYASIENYRIICIEGIIKVIFPLYNNFSNENIIIELIKQNFESTALKIYKCLPIKLMYIDVNASIEDSSTYYKIVVTDAGSIFNIRKQLSINDSYTLQMLLLEYLQSNGIGRIPIFAVSGTNGKTTTARLINDLLLNLGYYTGLTCTGYISFGRNLYETGDTTGFLSARTVLKNKAVEVAVFETARGGIIRNGLGFEYATASILTNVSEDHINIDNIQIIKDLAHIKSVILEEVHPLGKWIVKAQKEIIEEAHKSFELMTKKGININSFEKMVCLFSIEKNSFICEHIRNGGEAFYTDGDYIIHNFNGNEFKLINYKELEFTHFGISKGNIQNIMAALAALTTLPIKTEKILNALKTIPCDYKHNIGRQNIIKYKDFNIIIDYGHNTEAYNEIYSIVHEMHPSYVTSILSAPGDRQDKYIEELGYIAGKSSNFVILREHKNQRGSKEGRVSTLMKEGAVRAGLNEKQFIFILKDMEALEFAVKKAIKNEVIVFFTEEPEKFISKVTSYLRLS